MRYLPTNAPPRERVPIHLRGPRPLRVALSTTVASLIALVPAVAVSSPAQAAPGDIQITGAIGSEGSNLTFAVTYTGLANAIYTFGTVPITATSGTDYNAATNPTSVMFLGGLPSQLVNVTVATNTDQVSETDESFYLTATSPGNNDFNQAVGTIQDVGPPPTYQLTTTNPVSELAVDGTSKTTRVTATLSEISGSTVTIPLQSVDGTAISTGTAPRDYVAVNSSIVIPAGQRTGFIDVTILDDLRNEDTIQSFTVVPSAPPTNTTALTTQSGQVTVNIQDDDAVPTVVISGAGEVVEGLPLGFPLTLSAPSEKVVSVDVSTTDGADGPDTTGATAPADYTAVPAGTRITWPAETTNQTAIVQTTEDTVFEESPETLSATIVNPLNATLGVTTTAMGSINDDDDAPTVTLSPLTAAEGDSDEAVTEVTATLSTESDVPAVISYTQTGGTALDGTDFMSRTGTVTIPAGDLTAQIPVEIIGDEMDEPDETLTITLGTPDMSINTSSVGARTFTITDDDDKPTYTLEDLSVVEGDVAATQQISVTLSNPSSEDIDFTITSADGSAVTAGGTVGGDDYEAPLATLRIASGETVGYVDVTVNGDTVFERAEEATISAALAPLETGADTTMPVGVQHSATLTLENDDDVPVLTIGGTTGSEGTSIRMIGLVTGSSQDPLPLALEFAASGADAASESDYDISDSDTTPTIAPGASTVAFGEVFLNQDTIDEATETFTVFVTESMPVAKAAKAAKAKAAKVAKATAIKNGVAPEFIFAPVEADFKITDDPGDLPPTASISDESIVEDEGSVDLTVSLEFTGTTTSTEQDFTAPWMTENGTAVAGQDFVGESKGLLVIPAGELSGTVNVEITNDSLYEPEDEMFTVRLGAVGPAGATVGKAVGEVTIESEDDPSTPTMITPASIRGVGSFVVTGSADPGATVELMLGKFGTTTPLVKKTETKANSAGKYAFTVRIGAATRFGVRANGLSSIERTVRIVQVPGLAVVSRTTGAVTFTVQGNPKIANQTVNLQRQRANGTWYIVARGNTGSTRVYVKTQTGFSSGAGYTFRAYVVGDSTQGTLTGYSPAKYIRVR